VAIPTENCVNAKLTDFRRGRIEASSVKTTMSAKLHISQRQEDMQPKSISQQKSSATGNQQVASVS
jgi:hypothetical protein